MALKAAGALVLGLVGLSAWWFGVKGADSSPALASAVTEMQSAVPLPQAAQPVSPAALSITAAASSPSTIVIATDAETSAREKAANEDARIKRQAAAKARREQAARERAAAEEQARAAEVLAQQRADEALRQKAAAEAAQLARATRPPPAPPAPVVKTVEQTCASSGNFFSREACRLRSCASVAFATDPVCVRFREVEEANRRAITN